MSDRTPSPSLFDRALAEQIEFEREVRDWTIARVIERAKMSRSTYDRIASVERSPRIEQLQALADAFGLTGSELLRRAEAREARMLSEADEL